MRHETDPICPRLESPKESRSKRKRGGLKTIQHINDSPQPIQGLPPLREIVGVVQSHSDEALARAESRGETGFAFGLKRGDSTLPTLVEGEQIALALRLELRR